MSRLTKDLLLTILSLGLSGVVNSAQADSAFYKEKVITLLVGDGRGSETDVTVRLFAKYWGKYIEGKPNFKVKNFSKNKSLVWKTGDKGKTPNGLAVIYSKFKPLSQLLAQKGSKIDYKTMSFIGGFVNPSLVYVSTLVAKRPEHLLNVAGVRYGGGGSTDPVDMLGRFGLDVLGIKYVYAAAYRGVNQTFKAMVDGNIEIQSVPLNFYRNEAESVLVKTGKVIPLWYNPWPGHEKMAIKLTGYVSSYADFYKKVKGKAPVGKKYENYKWMAVALNGLTYASFLPPKSPKAAVRALRQGFARVAQDKEFLEEQQKKIGFNLPYVSSESGNQIINLMTKASKERVMLLRKLVDAGV